MLTRKATPEELKNGVFVFRSRWKTTRRVQGSPIGGGIWTPPGSARVSGVPQWSTSRR